MGRKLSFSREDAMDAALKEFWRNGYHRTSLEDLLKAMEIKNSSFYQSFQSKEQLFLDVLTRYRATFAKERLATLNNENLDGRQRLQGYFKHAIFAGPRLGYPVGCFMSSTAATLSDKNSVVSKEAIQALRTIENHFRKVLVAAHDNGETRDLMDPAEGARQLLIFLTGMAVVSRTHLSRKQLMDQANILIDVLLKKAKE